MVLYKVVITKEDGSTSALGKSQKTGRHGDGQYYDVPVNAERACKFTYEDAIAWKKHLEGYTKNQDGSIRRRRSGTVQVVPQTEYSAIACTIESLEKMEDCDKKQSLISHYQDLLERNDRS